MKINKIKIINLSILFKLLIPTICIVTTLATTLSLVSYNIQKENLISDGINITKLIANVASNTIEPHLIPSVRSNNDKSSKAYSEIFKVLQYTNSSKSVNSIYTLFLKDGKLYYGVDASLDVDKRHSPGDEYEPTINSDIYKTILNGKIYSSAHMTSSPHTSKITTLSPVIDATGNIMGAIACDYNTQPIITKLNDTTSKYILSTCIAIILTTIFITSFLYNVMNILKKINNKMETIVNNEGDLTQQINISSQDILGHITGTTNKFLNNIRKMMINIQNGANTIDKSMRSSYENMQIANENITCTDNTLSVVNSSMDKVVMSCKNIASTSSIILDTVNSINSLIHKGVNNAIIIKKHANDSNIENTQKYKEAQQKASILTKKLNAELTNAKEINKIANLTNNIIQITEQTNILALNASIEAARSGDAEKGFSIVAEEISKLASTTEESANEIQSVTDNVINSVNELTDSAHKMLYFLDNVLFKGFEQLVDNSTLYLNDSEKLATILQAFAKSTMSLTANIEEVQSSIKIATDSINTNADNIEDITNITKDLNNQITKLYHQINTIKEAGEQLNTEVSKFIV